MRIAKSCLLSIFIICSINQINAMNQNHEFDIERFNEVTYKQELSQLHPAKARDFAIDQLVQSMVLIFELKQEKIALQQELIQEQRESRKNMHTLSELNNNLSESLTQEKSLNKYLFDKNSSLQKLNAQLYHKFKEDKSAHHAKLNTIKSLNESCDSI
jgi:hypothetical protein